MNILSRSRTVILNLFMCLLLALSFVPAGIAGQVTGDEPQNVAVYLPLTLNKPPIFRESTGVLDPAFSGDGLTLTNYDGSSESARDIVQQPDGMYVVTGAISTVNSYDVFVARFNAEGHVPEECVGCDIFQNLPTM